MMRAHYKNGSINQILSILGLLLLLTLPVGCSRQMRPTPVGPTHLEEGLIAYEQNQYEEALKHLEAALKIDPQNTEALFRRGIIFQKQGKTDEAIAAYREVVRIDPNHFKAHYNLGNLYSYEKSNNAQAIFHYRRFIDMAPTHPLISKVQLRLTELTEGPADKFAHGKSAPGEAQEEVHLTGEFVAPPPVSVPATPVSPDRPTLAPTPSPPSEPVRASVPSQAVCVYGEGKKGKMTGSGFVVSGGYILTSGHEATQASAMSVEFQDGSQYPATLLSVSEAFDLALLKISTEKTAPLSFVTANSGKIGETVFTAGCPLGLDQSLSQGIISGPDRLLGGKSLLQTDVAINPGNSGGPLLNRQGEVVGVVVGLIPEARGIAFAVPAREAKQFLGESFFQMGTLLAEAKRYPEAAETLSESARFSPQSAKTFNNLGEVYRRMKETKKAEQAYLKALEINSKYADAHYNLGLLYDNVLRNSQKAALHYRKYLDLKPTSAEAAQVAQWLSTVEEKKGTP